MNNIIKSLGFACMLAVLLPACSDSYLETLPTSSVSTSTIFQDTDGAKMAINGMARLMVSQYSSYGQVFCGEGTIKFLFGEYMGENFSRPNLASSWYRIMNGEYMDNNSSGYNSYPWYYYYMVLGNANEFLAQIDNASGTEADRQFLKAQAYTYRAYCYTQLAGFYCCRWDDSNNGAAVENLKNGLVLRTEENRDLKDLPLVSSGEIYQQIYSDLDDAIALYKSSTTSRDNVWEPDINVAYAVYARAALTRKDYATAASMAANARLGYTLMNNSEYISGFDASNGEWIWGSYGGSDQALFYYGFHSYMAYDADTSIMKSYPVCMSKSLYDQIPGTDIRKEMFLDPGSDNYSKVNGVVSTTLAGQIRSQRGLASAYGIAAYMSFKFSIKGSRGIGYINHFRASEMYLTEAEACYHLNRESDARTLMNQLVRDSKRDEAYTCAATGVALLKEIKLYRAVELWGEGFDWLDKKRYNEPLVRLSFADGGNFHSTVSITRNVDERNKWTYVTPLLESENNEGM